MKFSEGGSAMENAQSDGAMVVPELTARPRQGYACGAQGVEQILRKSEQILIEEGFAALKLRRIAAECGMTQGNLSYYFKTKSELVLALIDAITESYRLALREIHLEAALDPNQQLRRLVAIYLDDVATRRTTRIFTELWAISSRDALVNARLKGIYDVAAQVFASITSRLNPALNPNECHLTALSIVAILEGQTVLVGNAMPYADHREPMTEIACRTIVDMVLRVG